VAHRLPRTTHCLNCGRTVEENFCPACGQETTDHTVGASLLLRDLAEEFLKLDSRILQTLIPLLFRPGFLTKEYIAGRRVRYIAPFKLFLFASALFFLCSLQAARRDLQKPSSQSAFHFEVENPSGGSSSASGKGATAQPQASERPDPVEQWFDRKLTRIRQLGEKEAVKQFYEQLMDLMSKVIFFLVPLFAGMLKVLYLRRYYIEHLYFALHLHAFLFLITLPVLFWDAAWLALTYLAVVAAYLFQAMRVVYQQGIFQTVWKLLLLMTGYVLLLLLTLTLLAAISFVLL
jgi:hypothetical protein